LSSFFLALLIFFFFDFSFSFFSRLLVCFLALASAFFQSSPSGTAYFLGHEDISSSSIAFKAGLVLASRIRWASNGSTLSFNVLTVYTQNGQVNNVATSSNFDLNAHTWSSPQGSVHDNYCEY
jgi:hypothetical protein